jgi:hypothetical protein
MKLFCGTKFSTAGYQKCVIMKPNEKRHPVCYSCNTKLHFLCLSVKWSYWMRSHTLTLRAQNTCLFVVYCKISKSGLTNVKMCTWISVVISVRKPANCSISLSITNENTQQFPQSLPEFLSVNFLFDVLKILHCKKLRTHLHSKRGGSLYCVVQVEDGTHCVY